MSVIESQMKSPAEAGLVSLAIEECQSLAFDVVAAGSAGGVSAFGDDAAGGSAGAGCAAGAGTAGAVVTLVVSTGVVAIGGAGTVTVGATWDARGAGALAVRVRAGAGGGVSTRASFTGGLDGSARSLEAGTLGALSVVVALATTGAATAFSDGATPALPDSFVA